MNFINSISTSFAVYPFIYIIGCALLHILIAVCIFHMRRKQRILKRHGIVVKTQPRMASKVKSYSWPSQSCR